MSLNILSKNEIFSEKPKWRDPGRSEYLAMYSSVFGGVVTDPSLMVLPIDDHMVHRGDGVFEACKCVGGYIYNFDAHLSRLRSSAELISMELPFDLGDIKQIAIEAVAIAGVKDCSVRIFISRGIGGFKCEPKECPKSNLYVVILKTSPVPQHFYTEGVSVATSRIPIKPPFFAQIKSCNYLPNALVEMEAHQNKVDFTVMLDRQGYLAEAATKSIAIVSKQKVFIYPKFDSVLKGTTLLRAVELTKDLIEKGDLRRVSCANISPEEVHNSSEMFLFSTTPNILPVVKCDGKRVGTGKPGAIFHRLWGLFQKDIRENKKILTPIFKKQK
ncbi:MAG: aminotransferase class IV [Candidatus Aerophobetes bacterium]|nr:aminotransferase class IV [Candidatus Aerophobetes bacterium]